ncbi:MAG: heme d1 biosynthesis radical SAM protein NirJ [Rhodocyclaceae bacterium]|nr:MAG: heme d1 biosynthesis radical SAM protein NirJ [Rhodocyclaceae bacterium]
MFRITQYMHELHARVAPESGEPALRVRSGIAPSDGVQASGPRRLPGPVVIWNLIRRCNLTCKHCYSISADTDFKGELSTLEAFAVMDDLKHFRVPVLILSGGEPLLRPDIFDIARRAKDLGFYTALSTNGTLIDARNIERIAAIDFDYVGVSLDGMGETHDRFRRKAGAFDASLAGIRLCRDLGLKVGVRYTMTQDNAHDFEALLRLVEREGIDRFYFSHLNYAGRGNKNRKDDARHQLTRSAMNALFDTCWAGIERGEAKEFTTGNNDADGPFFLQWVHRRFPEHVEAMRARLRQWGGNASGINVANIDNLGNVHPDTMWWHHALGNVRERPFSAIWSDPDDTLLAGLRTWPRPLKGRCGKCRHAEICNGSSRVRAEQVTGDVWQEDPGCYLDDEEIGIEPGGERVTLKPWIRLVQGRAA